MRVYSRVGERRHTQGQKYEVRYVYSFILAFFHSFNRKLSTYYEPENTQGIYIISYKAKCYTNI